MQHLLSEQRRVSVARLEAARAAPATIEERVARQRQKQFEEGSQIFATQYSSIHKCAQTDNIAGLMHFLKKERQPVDSKDRWGNTSLLLACERGLTNSVAVLLKEAADPQARNTKGQTAAHAAAVGGHAHVLRTLYAAGASVVERDETGATPACYAAQADNVEILRVLYGECQTAATSSIFESSMNNGLRCAHQAALFDSAEALAYLHHVGCDLEALDRSLETPAHKAARVRAMKALAFLTSVQARGANRNAEGDTADALLKQS